MALWTCPCGALNKSGDTQCEACARPRAGEGPAQAQQPTSDMRCGWLEGMRRCYLAAGIGAKAARCTWHSHVADRVRLADDYEEFERWATQLRDARYCCDWTHDPPEDLWRAVHGEAALPPYPKPCKSEGCQYAEFPEVDRADALAALRAIGLRALAGAQIGR